MSDPVRLLSSSRNGVARALLESANSPDPTSDQRDALWISIASKLPGAGAAGAALAKAATSKAVGAGMLLKGALVLGVVGTMAAVGLARPWLSRPEASPETAPRAVASASPAPPPPRAPVVGPVAPAPVAPAPVIADPAPAPEPEPMVPSRPVPRAFATRRAPSAAAEISTPSAVAAVGTPPPAEPEPATALQDESASLLRSRQLLRSGACGQALAQLAQAATRFPAGVLAQEREILSIEALACGGRATEASTRAEAFARANPSSMHVTKVRRFLQ